MPAPLWLHILELDLVQDMPHLRKAMNFSNEAFYNIWRIAVRIALPIAIIAAIAAVLGKLF